MTHSVAALLGMPSRYWVGPTLPPEPLQGWMGCSDQRCLSVHHLHQDVIFALTVILLALTSLVIFL